MSGGQSGGDDLVAAMKELSVGLRAELASFKNDVAAALHRVDESVSLASSFAPVSSRARPKE